MQRIEVKNFGPLDDITLDIKDYMVFIGPQASGKSTLAKLIYFFWKVEGSIYRKEIVPNFALSKILNPKTERKESVEKLKQRIRELFLEFFPTHRNGQIKFINTDKSEILLDVVRWSENLNDDIVISNSFFSDFDEIEGKFNDETNIGLFLGNQKFNVNDLPKDQRDILSQGLLQNLLATLSKTDSEEIFIPAGRSILSLLSNSFIFIENKSLDYFNESFIKLTNIIRKFLVTRDYSDNFGMIARMTSKDSQSDIFSLANHLSFRILKGDFHTDSNGDGIMHYYNGSGFVVPLKYTSSGQQESTWLINTIQYLLFNSSENEFDIVLEEPETHLFPDAQRDITNLITILANQKENQTRLIVTTHSPYILATLNNSIKAFTIGQLESKSPYVANIVNKELWINPENLFVGFMRKSESEGNFTLQDIFNADIKLIKHEVLDSVSDDIMNQFDDLLEIQYSE